MDKTLMVGNEALAEAAVRAGCRFYSGYPITPQTEVLEYLSWRMEETGGQFIQTESEISGIYMLYGAAVCGKRAMTTSSGPGISLMQEGISYLVAADIPCVIVDVARYGNGLGDISQGQGDYSLLTRGNGHGDTRPIVLAPNSVQENADMVYEAFDLAEKYRHPVMILSDAAIGQMIEQIELPAMKEHDIDKYDWYVKGSPMGQNKRVANVSYYVGDYDTYLREKYAEIDKNEQRYENYRVGDAEVVIVAYGISSRIAREAVNYARQVGLKLGLIRLKTLVPYPVKAFEEIPESCKGLLCVEMNILGQMVDDVKVATKSKYPVYFHGSSKNVPETEDIIAIARAIQENKAKEVL